MGFTTFPPYKNFVLEILTQGGSAETSSWKLGYISVVSSTGSTILYILTDCSGADVASHASDADHLKHSGFYTSCVCSDIIIILLFCSDPYC